jgi:non-heme chloroperoxidase
VTPYHLKTDDNPEGVDQKVFDEMLENLKEDRPAFLEKFGHMFYGRTVVHHTVSEAFLQFTQSMAMTGPLRQRLIWYMPGAKLTFVKTWLPFRANFGDSRNW